MTKNRRSAAISATIAFALSAPLMFATTPVRADEISDLRANQELLQRRLDQLAQAPAPGNPFGLGGPPGPTTVQMMGGSFPRSFLIPGTDTSIRLGGEVREVFDYWFTGGAPNATPQTTTLGATGLVQTAPLHVHTVAGNPARSRSHSIFSQTPKESKLSVETRTPTAWGEARTYIEFDFSGSNAFVPGGAVANVADNLIPRLRFAYGTLGGFLAGQANSNFSDPDANGETIDFGGNLGEPGVVRVPQVRYTMPLASWGLLGALSFSVETPETDVWTAGAGIIASDQGAGTTTAIPALACPAVAGVATCAIPGNLPAANPTKAPAPDLTVAWYIPQSWGHMDFGAVVRPALQIKDGLFVNRTYTGYGGHFGGDVKPGWFGWKKDDIIFHFVAGDAIGRYLNASPNFGLITNYGAAAPGSAAAAANILVRPVRSYGGEIGYQHWWAANLRSNINGGVHWRDVNTRIVGCAGGSAAAAVGAGGCGLNKEVLTAHANLIWNPVSFVDVGIEYMWGHRTTVSNLKGDENAITGKFAVKF